MVRISFGPSTVDLPYSLRLFGVTDALFDELVDEETRAELIDGVMVVHSPASLEHDDLGGFLRAVMRLYAEAKELGKVLGPDSLVHLASCRRFEPDAYFVRRQRVRRPRPKEFEGAPDLVLEILSSSNRAENLNDKRPAYREAGVPEIWLVDAEKRRLTVDRKLRKRYAAESLSRGRVASQAMPGFWLDVAWLWEEPLPAGLACLQEILAAD